MSGLRVSGHLRKASELVAWTILITFVLIAVLAPYLANQKPYFIKWDNQSAWPIFHAETDYRLDTLSAYDVVVFAPIPFNLQGFTKIESRLKPPGFKEESGIFKRVHWLGTEKLGRDVAAGIIYGCRKSIWIAFLTMTLAAFAGILFGASAGYWGNHFPLNFTRTGLPTLLLTFYLGYLVYYRLLSIEIALLVVTIFFIGGLIWNLQKNPGRHFLLDIVVVKLIEVFQSIPALLLLMVIAALVKVPSIFTLAWLIGLVRWTSFCPIYQS
ncbi:MAG: hypothetical protein IPL46_27615 [Saprospiraceae bacterium]|nr:hypothetical protein [Saprospiraceae bacterium]